MSTARRRLVLELEPPDVERLAEQVVAALGWDLERSRDGARIVYEDAVRLHCHCSPLRAELDLAAIDAGRSELVIEGKVAGWGPLSSQHAREQTDLLARRLCLAAAEATSRKAVAPSPGGIRA